MYELMGRSRRRGSTSIEYALFLALIAGGVVLAADTVSYAMRGQLEVASLALQSGVELRHLPDDAIEADKDIVAALIAPDGDATVRAYQFASVAGSLFCGGLVWYGLYCRRTRRRVDVAHDLTAELNDAPPEISHDELFTKRHQILRILGTDMPALLESRLEARHVMSRKLYTIAPTAKVEEIRALMEEHKLRHLLVCDTDGLLVGIVSDRDLKSRTGTTAQQLMTRELITVEPQALVNPAITLMINRRISCLPVVSDGIPLGVMTSTDLMMTLQCAMQILQRVAHGVSPNSASERRGKSISSLLDIVPQPTNDARGAC